MKKAKIILVNGFAGIGKTTLCNRYISDNPLSISIEGDKFVTMIGQWLKYQKEARDLVFQYTKKITEVHAKNGHDVLLPYLPPSPDHAEAFEKIAKTIGAEFIEIYLSVDRKQAIKRLFKRGVWGEEGSEQLSEADIPEINQLYDDMETALSKRPNTILMPCIENEIDKTYKHFLSVIKAHSA